MKNIFNKNALFILGLGLVLALYITTTFERAIIVSLILIISMFIYSLFLTLYKKIIPKKIMMPVVLITIGLIITAFEYLFSMYLPDLLAEFGMYLPIIAVSTLFINYDLIIKEEISLRIILSKMMITIIGYSVSLILIATIREILGSGTLTIIGETSKLLGYRAIYSIYPVNSILPISALLEPAFSYILVGILMAIFRTKRGDLNA